MTFERALITGATGGIGEAFANRLSDDCDLILTGRNPDRLEEMTERLAKKGRMITAVQADLTRPKDRQRVIAAARDIGIDLLINNAGIGGFKHFLEQSEEEEEATAELNCVAPTVLSRSLLPLMLKRARQRESRAGIIFMSSILAALPTPIGSTYSASKTYLLHLAEGIAAGARGEPVDVLASCPGPVKTPALQGADTALQRQLPAIAPKTVVEESLKALGQQSIVVPGLPRSLVNALTLGRRTSLNALDSLASAVAPAK